MMQLSLKLAAFSMLLMVLLLTACQPEEKTVAVQTTGIVEASQAYLDNFGTPPQGKAGRAFARVGYLPLQNSPEKLRPLPLFLFSEEEQVRQIIERLISGKLLLHRESDLYHPFPDDLQVSVTSADGPTTKLALTTQQSWSATDQAAAGLALAETVLQFPAMESVIITHNGAPLPHMPKTGYLRQPQALLKVEPPRLILMAGVWEAGADDLSEILVEFDRPIKVNAFKLHDADGHVVDGDYFTSLFQMAVVIHPQEPGRYQEGVVLRAEWDVVDDMGRANRGTDAMAMKRIDH